MKIAVPIWKDKVSPVFDTALSLLIIDYENQQEASRLVYHIGEEDLFWKCRRIKDLSPEVVICGAVSHLFLNMLKAAELDVIEHISGRVEDVLDAYLKGDILNSRFLMPGCKRHGYGCVGRNKIILKEKNQINEEDIK
jgi:predicted Fe-Mo cluster-binding NifX family protein